MCCASPVLCKRPCRKIAGVSLTQVSCPLNTHRSVNNSAGVQGGAIAAISYSGLYILSTAHTTLNGTANTVYTLFQGNTAPVGGALSLITTPATISQALFINNSATLPSTVGGQKSGLKAPGCGFGQGGAVCVVGDNQTLFYGQSLIFAGNQATFGGGMSVHASPSCTPLQTRNGCFTTSLDSESSFLGNSAVDGAGGAIFWAHQGNLQLSCNGSSVLPQRACSVLGTVSAVSESVQPCSYWGQNTVSAAGYGPVIASTPYYLQPGTQGVPFYSSNQPLLLNVTMQVRAAGDYQPQPTTTIRAQAETPEVQHTGVSAQADTPEVQRSCPVTGEG